MPIRPGGPVGPTIPKPTRAGRLVVCLGCVAVFLALVGVDLLLTPPGVHLRVLFRLPLLCLAWNYARYLAWGLALTVYPLHLVLYPAAPHRVSWLGPAINLGLSLAVLGLEIEMVWRARHSLQQLGQAVHRASSGVPGISEGAINSPQVSERPS